MAKTSQIKDSTLMEYFDECQEMLDKLYKNIAHIEKNGFDKEVISSIYREMHTLKGSSQLFGFLKIGSIAHIMETSLDPVRKEKVKLAPELIDSIYIGLDFITYTIEKMKEIKSDPDLDNKLYGLFSKFLSSLEYFYISNKPLSKDKILLVESCLSSHSLQNVKSKESDKKNRINQSGLRVIEMNTKSSINQSNNKDLSIYNKEVNKNISAKNDASELVKKSSSEEVANDTIRVQVNLLSNLMNLVGELVLIRNQLLQYAKLKEEDPEFLKISQRLNLLTAELQNEVMKTRLQPIGHILTIFTRVVRDLSRELGKKIELVLKGIETELDKSIIEAIKDPLMHIVRNAVDHGIETIDERIKLGKSEIAVIEVNAYNESGHVIVDIKDDGRGLDRNKIGQKAIEKGLILKENYEKMSEKEVQSLIFMAGFSTADKISNISGRGVGMDVVKTNIEQIGGHVDIFSEVGLGSTFSIKIPLSLAIIPALIVQTNRQRFAIPQSKLVELLRIDFENKNSEKIELLHGKYVLRLRGKLLPIVSLNDVLFSKNLDGNIYLLEKIKKSLVINIVVLDANHNLFGLVVDEIDDSADIVVKSLSQFLKDLKVYSGATIMGDGSIALTIDVLGIAEKLNFSNIDSSDKSNSQIKNLLKNHYQSNRGEYLTINVGAPSNYAMPLSIVNRLEEFDKNRFEFSGEQKVIRYRDLLLPIFSLPKYLNFSFYNSDKIVTEKVPVVVIKRGNYYYGIEVFEINDIIESAEKINYSIKDRPGILGTISTDNNIIVIVDIFYIIDNLKSTLNYEMKKNDIYENEILKLPKENFNISRKNYRILLVEDSSFFRNYIKSILEEVGYIVETAYDGSNALEFLNRIPKNYISLILSDIEMPIIDGIEMAKKIRNNEKFHEIPMFAITTKFSKEDAEVGLAAGFNKYFEKINAEKLIAEVDYAISKIISIKE